jgi:hypothetical protein
MKINDGTLTSSSSTLTTTKTRRITFRQHRIDGLFGQRTSTVLFARIHSTHHDAARVEEVRIRTHRNDYGRHFTEDVSSRRLYHDLQTCHCYEAQEKGSSR